MELLDFQRDWLLWFYTHSMYHAPEIRQIAVKLMVTSDKIGVDARRTVEVDLVDGANYFVTTPDIHAFANLGTDPNAASDITFDLFDGRIVPRRRVCQTGQGQNHLPQPHWQRERVRRDLRPTPRHP
ncbi:MAG: hypothetical protein IPK17_30370 [Chloroflexi bacterium]|uniref:hypothetical protein n=1 Tax=Candidatus Flexifilum breve TaxID=3140694 RepID=UPI00313768B7|nr:hypothetical protein [Chloroflexota bacterium]